MRRWVPVLSCLFVLIGFLLPLWPLEVAGVLLSALSGQWLLAVCLGLILDLLYGAPLGHWHFIEIPFTFLALLAALARFLFMERVREGIRETL